MDIRGIEKGKYYFIVVHEHLTVKDVVSIKAVVEQAIEKGYFIIVFDVSTCENIDSSGIGLIVNIHKRCSAEGGRVGFLNPTANVREIISIANVESMIRIYNSVEAIEADS